MHSHTPVARPMANERSKENVSSIGARNKAIQFSTLLKIVKIPFVIMNNNFGGHVVIDVTHPLSLFRSRLL